MVINVSGLWYLVPSRCNLFRPLKMILRPLVIDTNYDSGGLLREKSLNLGNRVRR